MKAEGSHSNLDDPMSPAPRCLRLQSDLQFNSDLMLQTHPKPHLLRWAQMIVRPRGRGGGEEEEMFISVYRLFFCSAVTLFQNTKGGCFHTRH